MKVLPFLFFIVTSTVFPGVGARRINDVLNTGYGWVSVLIILQVVSFASSLTWTVPVKTSIIETADTRRVQQAL